jgi:GNAT superfamily N-acetyltransferase
MKIVYYDEKHLKPCSEILMAHYNNNDFKCNFTKHSAMLYLQELIFKPRFIGFLLLEKEHIIGFAFCHIRTWSDSDELHIDEFLIRETHQLKGIGTRLLDFITTYATSYNLSGITTTTNVISLAQFYQKNDFLDHDITFLYKGIKSKS